MTGIIQSIQPLAIEWIEPLLLDLDEIQKRMLLSFQRPPDHSQRGIPSEGPDPKRKLRVGLGSIARRSEIPERRIRSTAKVSALGAV
jgi:hypothetical protein